MGYKDMDIKGYDGIVGCVVEVENIVCHGTNIVMSSKKMRFSKGFWIMFQMNKFQATIVRMDHVTYEMPYFGDEHL